MPRPNHQLTSDTGTVYLVGAGPGDPGLITLRGLGCLQQADAVLYDYLCNPLLLDHAPPQAERICLGRHGRAEIWSPEAIHARMVQLAREGKTVVRLKGGDPSVFSRVAQEVEALEQASIAYEIVPGVTAGLAAASYAGVHVTHRDVASAVALVAGQENPDKYGPSLDFHALARFPGTLIFYMGVTTAPRWTQSLITAGLPADTPAVIVRRCSLPDQVRVCCRLDEVAAHLSPRTSIPPPVVVIVGRAAGLNADKSWFERRPLFGKRVMVTRPRDQCLALGELLMRQGADCIIQPAIQITDPTDWTPVDDCLAHLARFDWLVFSSANGVRRLLERLFFLHHDLRALGGRQLAAIGPGTADELARYHLRADLQPAEYRAEALASVLAPAVRRRRVLLVRASRGREVLAQRLCEAGADVEQAVVYESCDVATADAEAAAQLEQGRIDWITVTSSAIARSLVKLFGAQLRRARLVSISPVTSATLRELGYPPDAEAETYTMAGVVDALLRGVNR